MLPDGCSYGPAPLDLIDDADMRNLPDLVAVVGDAGKHGYADASVIFGDDGIDSPEQAAARMAQQSVASRRLPVLDVVGETIDVFTVQSGRRA